MKITFAEKQFALSVVHRPTNIKMENQVCAKIPHIFYWGDGGAEVISVDGRAKTYNIRQGRLRISIAPESVFGRMVISRTWRILEILFLKLTIISSSRWLALYVAKIKIWRNVLKGRRENVRESFKKK